jgi:hypothetical protein
MCLVCRIPEVQVTSSFTSPSFPLFLRFLIRWLIWYLVYLVVVCLFREIIAVHLINRYIGNYRVVFGNCKACTVTAGGKYSDHWILNAWNFLRNVLKWTRVLLCTHTFDFTNWNHVVCSFGYFHCTHYMEACKFLCVLLLVSFFSFIYYSGIDDDTFNYSLRI